MVGLGLEDWARLAVVVGEMRVVACKKIKKKQD